MKRLVREEIIVGFDDEAKTLIKYLTEESQELDIISVIGMPGLGKTTLAVKIFRDPIIQNEFPTRLWFYVSQEFRKKDVFLSILSNFRRITDDMYQKTDQEIAETLHQHLERGRFLIVMDDVCTAKAWVELQEAFPKSNKGSKILITSRNKEVSRQANRNRAPHLLRLLRPDESWLLFQLEVFGKEECPYELEVHGKLIVEQCKNVPLVIVLIGGTLVETASCGDMGVRINALIKVSERLSAYLNQDQYNRLENIIAFSYNGLPYYLRQCFLYLGIFPENFEIPVRKLTLMWIAEGFIPQKVGIDLEETAQDYVEDLVNRNLVMVEKMRLNGKIKTCRIHDMLRDFCKNKAKDPKENFFQEMKMTEGNIFEPSISEVRKFRRLCINSNILKFMKSKPLYGPEVRSFLCFSKEEITLVTANNSAIPDAFQLLRVLDSKALKFTEFPSGLTQLVHLRYLVLSSNFKVLPESLSKLWNIQTLIVDTTSRTLDIKANIWKMSQLRHVKTNALTTIPKPGKSNRGGTLRTLGTISPQSFTKDVFDQARSLKKLSIRGQVESLLDAEGLNKLVNLEKLKLLNDVFPCPPSEGNLMGLAQHYRFPPKLRSLTLSDTFLEWVHMSTLGMLDTLEELKLKNYAFMGEIWEPSVGGFRNLELLHIERTDLVIWSASGSHFPRLRCLVLRNCEKLSDIHIFKDDYRTSYID